MTFMVWCLYSYLVHFGSYESYTVFYAYNVYPLTPRFCCCWRRGRRAGRPSARACCCWTSCWRWRSSCWAPRSSCWLACWVRAATAAAPAATTTWPSVMWSMWSSAIRQDQLATILQTWRAVINECAPCFCLLFKNLKTGVQYVLLATHSSSCQVSCGVGCSDFYFFSHFEV